MAPEQEAVVDELDAGGGAGEEAEADAPVLDPEQIRRRAAAMSFVKRFGDPVLKSRATTVDRFDDALRNQVSRMTGLMEDAVGVGLAAPQLGVSQRLFVYRIGLSDVPIVVLANPEILWQGEEQETAVEGCLSIPGVQVEVERPVYVKVRGQDEEGETRIIEASGLEARVIQHEVDHLDGILILDRTSRGQRREAMRAMRERERAEQAA